MIYLSLDSKLKGLPLILFYFVSFVARQDTKLPDGSVNVAKDVTFGDVLGTAVGGVLNGAGAIIQGVKAGTAEDQSRTTVLISTVDICRLLLWTIVIFCHTVSKYIQWRRIMSYDVGI